MRLLRTISHHTSYGIALRDVEMLSEFSLRAHRAGRRFRRSRTNRQRRTPGERALNRCAPWALPEPRSKISVTDLKSLFDVILPGYLMADSSFETHFRQRIEEYFDREPKTSCPRMIQPFTLRRKKGAGPYRASAKIEDIRRCSLSEDQIRFYRDVVENQGRDLVQTLKDPDQNVPYCMCFAVLNYLTDLQSPFPVGRRIQDYGKYFGKVVAGKSFVELLTEPRFPARKWLSQSVCKNAGADRILSQ